MNEQIIFFKKTFNLYNEYKAKFLPYEDVTSIIREDEELLDDLFLKNKLPATFLFELEFDKKDVYDLNLCTDQTTDLLRLCYLTEIQNCFNNEYREYIERGVYFYSCSFNVYKKTYSTRLKEFQKCFIDAEEIDFIKKEFIFDDNEYVAPYENLPLKFSDNYYTNKEFSLKKRNEFLKTKMNKLDYEITSEEVDVSFDDARSLMTTKYSMTKKEVLNNLKRNISSINWIGTPTELTALIKALILSNKLDTSITEKETVKRFEQFFDFNLKNYEQTKSKISTLRTKDYTPFIDILKINFENWIKRKDERKPSK